MVGKKVRLYDGRLGTIVANWNDSDMSPLPPWAAAYIQLENGQIFAYSRNEFEIVD